MKDPAALLPAVRIDELDNGLTVGTVEDRRSPIVAVALAYRAGARDEVADHAGVAHFLEHMMFKGSPGYGPGEIDRLTRVLGGSNNAFTSHDATVYHFTFASDRWRQALEIEADRMAALTLDPVEVDSERRVILEELAMYESEPWDALEMRVVSDFFGSHPYGRPVLGTRDSLRAIDAVVLGDFHRRYYRPSNAVLVVAGDVGPEVPAAVAESFGAVDGEVTSRPAMPAADWPRELCRIERRQGQVPRLLLTLPGPGAGDPDHPLLMLLLAVLGSGRSSRLYRGLVDEGQLCSWVSTELFDTTAAGALVFALELVPGVEPEQVEDELLSAVDRLGAEGPTAEEVARAKKILLADWIFGHERVTQLSFAMASALAFFDAEHPRRYLRRLLAAEMAELRELAARFLRPGAGGVLGWSLPRESSP
ncbi:MAG: pitrilysin family protein [Thermoanaerobaculia bacterium]